MRSSRNFDELKHVWTEWHKQSGGKMRLHYQQFVELSNEAARLNSSVLQNVYKFKAFNNFSVLPLDYSDTGAFWLRNYESDTFKADIENVWQTIKPFYQQLHAYVRSRLRTFYGEDKIPRNEPIPAHLLGIELLSLCLKLSQMIICTFAMQATCGHRVGVT